MDSEKVNYSELGLKCGLEIHQQLNTKKLFCDCPSLLRSEDPDFFIRRKLHAVAGESGEVDVAAKYQSSLNKNFVYQGYEDTTCLVELDESPPREINKDALKIAVQVSLLLNCKIIPITQIMRKTVIDGSNTSGFQRTVLIAGDGYVDTASGRIGIQSICLEEDSARIISEKDNEVTYRLDRLGIPLIEIATFPDISNPEAAREVALYIGNVLRSCDVKRGIGTIRQDVNMSLRKLGGTRIEIKGVQEPSLIVKTINSEIEREVKENKKVEPQVRKALPDGSTEFLRPMPGASRMYPETDLPLLRIRKEFIDEVKRSLPKLSSEIAGELKKYGLHEELIKLILKGNKVEEFNELVLVNKNPELVAKVLVLYPKELASKNNLSEDKVSKILNKDILVEILESVAKKKINERQVKDVLERIVTGIEFSEAVKFEEHDSDKLEEKIINLIREKPGLSGNAYMGLLMKEFKRRIDAKTLMEIISKHLKKD
ncbi:MAG: Glu-tRNA(Gln) amidotransferase subunit GatE [Candidatus Nanoarchaeia archaeon]